MNKIDLIIDALEKAKDGWQCFNEYGKALVAARELRAMNLEQILNAAGFYRREWVELTDEEIGDVYVAWDNTDGASFADFARLIEARLRERNEN